MRSGKLVVLDAARRRIIRRVATGRGSKGLLVHPGGTIAFVSATDEGQVVEVDVREGRVVARFAIGAAPEGLSWLAQP